MNKKELVCLVMVIALELVTLRVCCSTENPDPRVNEEDIENISNRLSQMDGSIEEIREEIREVTEKGKKIAVVSFKDENEEKVVPLFIKLKEEHTRIVRETVPLFTISISDSISEELMACSNDEIPPELREKLSENGISLSHDATFEQEMSNWIVVDVEKHRWWWRDKKRIYILKRNEDKLSIYDHSVGNIEIPESARAEMLENPSAESKSFKVFRSGNKSDYYMVDRDHNKLILESIKIAIEDGFMKDILIAGRLDYEERDVYFQSHVWVPVGSPRSIETLNNVGIMIGPCKNGVMEYYICLADVINYERTTATGSGHSIPKDNSIILKSDGEQRSSLYKRSFMDSFDIRIYTDFDFTGFEERSQNEVADEATDTGTKQRVTFEARYNYDAIATKRMISYLDCTTLFLSKISPFAVFPRTLAEDDALHLDTYFGNPVTLSSDVDFTPDEVAVFERDLREESISDESRRNFNEVNNFNLSKICTVSTLKNNQWLIINDSETDDSGAEVRRYLVQKAADKLGVFEKVLGEDLFGSSPSFKIAVDFENDLEAGGVVSRNLRQEIYTQSETLEVALSDTTTIEKVGSNEWWIVDDRELHVFEETSNAGIFRELPSFDIAVDFENDLGAGAVVSHNLRQEIYAQSGALEVALSDTATIEELDSKTWIITDSVTEDNGQTIERKYKIKAVGPAETQKYMIKRVEGELSVSTAVADVTAIDLLEYSDFHIGTDLDLACFFYGWFSLRLGETMGFYQTAIKPTEDLSQKDLLSWYHMPWLAVRLKRGEVADLGISYGRMYLSLLDDYIQLRNGVDKITRFQMNLNIYPKPSKSLLFRGTYYSEVGRSSNNILSLQIGYSTPISALW